jgi:propanediol dehydratase small subunit
LLCSIFFAAQLNLAHRKSTSEKARTSLVASSGSDKSTQSLKTFSGAPAALASSSLTQEQLSELLASLSNLPDRPVWVRRAKSISSDRVYKGLFAQLKLNAEKASQLRALIVEQEHVRSQLYIALAKRGMTVNETLSAAETAIQSYDQKIEQLLGPNDYAVYSCRKQNPGNYSVLNEVISVLSVTQHPLSEERKREIYTAVLKTRDDESFMTSIARALPPEQVRVLLESLEAQTIQNELYQMRMEIYRRSLSADPKTN